MSFVYHMWSWHCHHMYIGIAYNRLLKHLVLVPLRHQWYCGADRGVVTESEYGRRWWSAVGWITITVTCGSDGRYILCHTHTRNKYQLSKCVVCKEWPKNIINVCCNSCTVLVKSEAKSISDTAELQISGVAYHTCVEGSCAGQYTRILTNRWWTGVKLQDRRWVPSRCLLSEWAWQHLPLAWQQDILQKCPFTCGCCVHSVFVPKSRFL